MKDLISECTAHNDNLADLPSCLRDKCLRQNYAKFFFRLWFCSSVSGIHLTLQSLEEIRMAKFGEIVVVLIRYLCCNIRLG